MGPGEFIDRLMSQVSLDAIDFASDVERLLAEQVVYLRDRLTAECRETEARSSVVIAELRERISDKDQLIAILQEDVRVLRGRA
jgi:hypothetical protein